MALELTSTAFQHGEVIPPKYTADGLNKSPPLSWIQPPEGTKSLALLCDDPDAPKGAFTHWIAFNIPPEEQELGEGVPQEPIANGTVQGENDMGQVGYAGPAPPRGKAASLSFQALCA